MAADASLPADQGMAQPPRLSRYRTVRKAQLEQQAQHSLPHHDTTVTQSNTGNMTCNSSSHPLPDTTAVGRSASRYRRTGKPLVSAPPMPTLSQATFTSAASSSSPDGSERAIAMSENGRAPGHEASGKIDQVNGEDGQKETTCEVRLRNPRYRSHAPTAPPVVQRKREISKGSDHELSPRYRSTSREQPSHKSPSGLSPPRLVTKEHGQPFEPRRLDDCNNPSLSNAGRPSGNDQSRSRSEESTTPNPPNQNTSSPQHEDDPAHPRSSVSHRRRKESPRSPQNDPQIQRKTDLVDSMAAFSKLPAVRQRKSIDQTANVEIPTIRPGGGGIVPQVDAPVSAANAGERRVMVTLRNSSMRFPVTLDTTPLQLLRSASNCFADDFDPRSSFVTEVFSKANVQRPIRMYEHIRDVMNSWDDDEQHELVIQPSTIDANNDLYESFAPTVCPPGASWDMHYSQNPGKWDKRLITLNVEGQLKFQKSEGKPATNICHLNDFDIYVPMPSRTKKIKAPKKFCFAIKSQQKSSMFMDTASFIHFFATNDETVATSFHRMVQDWRSWYLTDVLGEGKKTTTQRNQSIAATSGAHDVSHRISHSKNPSVDSHYVLGTFNDLDFDPANFVVGSHKERRDSAGSDSVPLGLQFPGAVIGRGRDKRNPHGNKKGHPPIAYGNRKTNEMNTRRSLEQQEQDSFAVTGLLGKEYAERQRQLQHGDDATHGGLRRNASVRSTGSHHGAPRASLDQGRGNAPKPLIDLTPQYAVPKQHQKKGKGFHPETLGPGGLIDNATTPEDPIAAPPSKDWRGANAATVMPGAVPSGNISHSLSMRDPHRAGIPFRPTTDTPPGLTSTAIPSSNEEPGFATNSLLASMQKAGKEGWGAGDRGFGVRRGATVQVGRGDKPMLELNMQSQFAAGSLLRDVERRGVGNPDS